MSEDFIKVIVRKNQADSVRVREGSKNGRDWRMADQKIWVFLDDEFPTEFQVNLPDGLVRIEEGTYKLTIESFKRAIRRGNYDSFNINPADLLFFPFHSPELQQEITAANKVAADLSEPEKKGSLFKTSTGKK